MSDVITRFKLETTQFDSKLRDTAKGLKEIAETAKNGGKDFNGFSQKAVEAARALGTVASGATNTKDKLRDLVGSYNDAVKAYDLLSDQAKNDEFGKAMAASLQKLQQDIKETKQELYGLGDTAGKMSGGLFSGDKMSGMLQVFGGNVMTKVAGVGMNFVSELGDMVKESLELAKAGEGVRIAFDRLNKPGLLDNLRQATHGTVTDLELMKSAVKFNDFKLPVEELGTMLAFAQQKAKDTGQSIDYMVDYIVTGLGRKSLMILDNLGLSAAEIKEKMGETGDMTKAVGEIIREQMSKAGEYVETAADRATKAAVDAKNKMEEFGRTALPVAEQWSNTWSIVKTGALDVLNNAVTPLINALTTAGRLRAAMQERGSNGRVSQQIAWLQNPGDEGRQSVYDRINDSYVDQINHARSEYNKLRKQAMWNPFASWKADNALAELNAIKQEFADFKEQAKPIMNPVKPVIDTNEAEQSVASLTKKLKELQAERQKAIKAGDNQKSKDLLKQINQTKADIKGLNKSTPTSGLRNSKTPNLTPSQQAEADVQKALKEYSDAIANAQEKVMANMITGDDYNKQVQQGQQRLADAYLKAYNVTGNDQYLEGFKESAERYNEMSDVIKENIDTQKQQQQAARELEQAQKKLAEAQQKLADAKASGSATAVYKAQAAVDRLKNPNAQAQPTGFAALRQSIQGELKFDQMNVDETTLRTLLSTAIKNGIDEVTVDYNLLQDKISKGIDIPDSTWKELQDEINAKLTELGIEPIKIDFNTGGLSTEGKKAEKSWQSAAVAVSAVGSAIQNIEDPAAKVVGTVAQAIATVALSFAQAMAKTSGPWEWVSFAVTGLATMISTISAIHSATGYANGGIVGGNSFSGDNVYGGPDAMVNSGELILNKAQQNVVAQELQGGSRMIQVHGVLRGKDIFIAAENWSKSAGKGEFVTW